MTATTMRVREHIDGVFGAAEQSRSCYAPVERAECDRMRRATRNGWAVCPHAGLFARPSYWWQLSATERSRHILRGLQTLHPDWVFASFSAALAHGLEVPVSYQKKVWRAIARADNRRTSQGAKRVVVTGDVPVERDGLRATSLERTVYDSLRMMGFRAGLAVADSALRRVGACADELVSRIREVYGRMPHARRVAGVVRLADGGSESGGESIARATMLELGFMTPELQRTFPRKGGEPYRVDFAWEVAQGVLLGELDGREKYLNPRLNGGLSPQQAIEREHRRQSEILAHEEVTGLVRFSFPDVLRWGDFARMLEGSGVPRTHQLDEQVLAAGGTLRS